MRLRLHCFVAFACLLVCAMLPAQITAPPPPLVQPTAGYPVVGRVICADTQRPARFAQVVLVPAANGVSDYDRGRMAIGRTDLDGRFTIGNVPPGDYYATAEMTGYIDEATAVRLALSQGGDALNSIASVPRVQVTAGGGSVQLSLQRGATISGVVQWDDGSPAAGISVNAQYASSTNGSPSAQFSAGFSRQGLFPNFSNGAQTDDRGHFRLSGLSPGSYVLRATVMSPIPLDAGGQGPGRGQRLTSLSVYAPNKLRKTDATVVTLAAGEERPDLNVVMALNGMHTVSGQVSSSAAAVRSGSVVLTDQTDSTLNRRGFINPDGSFTIAYVPAGTYTLRVSANAQAQTDGRASNQGSEAAVRFQPLQESITVADSDLTGLSVSVNPATSTQ